VGAAPAGQPLGSVAGSSVTLVPPSSKVRSGTGLHPPSTAADKPAASRENSHGEERFIIIRGPAPAPQHLACRLE
jgi:hypothetical protein